MASLSRRGQKVPWVLLWPTAYLLDVLLFWKQRQLRWCHICRLPGSHFAPSIQKGSRGGSWDVSDAVSVLGKKESLSASHLPSPLYQLALKIIFLQSMVDQIIRAKPEIQEGMQLGTKHTISSISIPTQSMLLNTVTRRRSLRSDSSGMHSQEQVKACWAPSQIWEQWEILMCGHGSENNTDLSRASPYALGASHFSQVHMLY